MAATSTHACALSKCREGSSCRDFQATVASSGVFRELISYSKSINVVHYKE